MLDNEFTINYDDQPEDIVDTISNALSEFGLTIEVVDEEGDGFVTYQIIQDTRKSIFGEEN